MPSYQDPAPGATIGRTDEGVDWSNVRKIVAVGSGQITKIYHGLRGFGTTVIERMSTGEYVYYAEETGGGTPTVHEGESVTGGQQIAPGTGGHIEVGLWNPSTGRAVGAPGYTEGASTAAGRQFRASLTGKSRPRTVTVTASVFGGPSDPGTGSRGYKGDDLNQKPDSFAELGMGHALGGLPYMAPITITYQGRSKTLYKRDIGAGGPGLQGKPRAVDVWWQAAQELQLPGLAVVTVTIGGDGGGGYGGNRPDGTADDSGKAVDALLASYEQRISMPRSAPASGFVSLKDAGWKAPFQWWFQSFSGNWNSPGGG